MLVHFISGFFTGIIFFKITTKKKCVSCSLKDIVIQLQENKLDDAFKDVYKHHPISYPDLDYCHVHKM